MIANIIIDVILAVIILFGFVWGIKSGFVRTVSKPVKFIMAIVLSVSLASLVGDAVVKPLISDPVVNMLTEYLTERCNELAAAGATEQLPTLIKLAAAFVGVDIAQMSGDSGQVAAIVEAVTDPILSVISSILAFIVLYFVFKLLMQVVFSIINSIACSGVIGVVNRVLGCVVMTFLAATVVWCLCGVSDFILNLPVLQEQEWLQGFTGGPIFNFFKNISPIGLLLGLLLSF